MPYWICAVLKLDCKVMSPGTGITWIYTEYPGKERIVVAAEAVKHDGNLNKLTEYNDILFVS